jgi:hypothetical protein
MGFMDGNILGIGRNRLCKLIPQNYTSAAQGLLQINGDKFLLFLTF